MNDLRKFILFLVCIVVFIFAIFKATQTQAFEIDNVRQLRLDQQTLQKGFTVKSYDDNLWLPIFPNQYNEPIEVKIEKLKFGNILPQDKIAVSAYYNYSIEDNQPGFLDHLALLAIHFDSSSLAPKYVYFYDNHYQVWRQLPCQVDYQKKIITAKTIFPSAQIIVVEDKVEDLIIVESAAELTAVSAIVVDKAGNLIFAKNPDNIRPIASLTKVVTAMVFMENNPGWDKQVKIIESDNVGGASLPLEPGDTIMVKDLFYATLTGSKNNAARALMRATGLPENVFINKMNEKVRQLGCEKTFFVEPTGLSEKNVSTAREMVEISRNAFNLFKFLEATTIRGCQVNFWRQGQLLQIWVDNTNKLLERDLYITGGKTGYTDEAGYNLVTQAKNQRHELLALVMGAQIKMNYEEVYQLLKKYL